MRVVLDTNILVSALLVEVGHPAAIYRAWQEGGFTLLTCRQQLDELRAVLHKPTLIERIKPYKAGHPELCRRASLLHCSHDSLGTGASPLG